MQPALLQVCVEEEGGRGAELSGLGLAAVQPSLLQVCVEEEGGRGAELSGLGLAAVQPLHCFRYVSSKRIARLGVEIEG